MTIIVYSKDILAADSRFLLNSDEAYTLNNTEVRQKIRVFGRKVAIAVCGSYLDDQEWDVLSNAAKIIIGLAEIADAPSRFKITWLLQDIIQRKGIAVIMMTKKKVYYIREDVVNIVENHSYTCYGSGEYVANIVANLGHDARFIVDQVCKVVPTCGYPMMSVHRSELIDFKRGISKAGIQAIRNTAKEIF